MWLVRAKTLEADKRQKTSSTGFNDFNRCNALNASCDGKHIETGDLITMQIIANFFDSGVLQSLPELP